VSFIPRTFGGLAAGLIDGKKGPLSNVGSMVGGPIDALGIGKKAQSLVDKTGVNGIEAKTGLNAGGNALPVRRLSGRGSSSLSV